MKFLKILISFIQKIIGLINVLLIIIIILNLTNLIAFKVKNNNYASFLGYTYKNIFETDETLNLKKGDFVLIDLNRSAIKEEIIYYQENSNFEFGKIIAIGTKDILTSENIHVDKENVIGTVIFVVPHLGTILSILLDSSIFFWTIIILIATSIIQILLTRAFKSLKIKETALNQISHNDIM